MNQFLVQSEVLARLLAKHLLRPIILIPVLIQCNLCFLPLFFMRGCCGFVASLDAWRWLLSPGKMKVGTALFRSFLHASLHHPKDQKGDLLAQRGGGKQGEVNDLTRAVWRENGKAGIC